MWTPWADVTRARAIASAILGLTALGAAAGPVHGQADSAIIQIVRTAAFAPRTLAGFVYNASTGEPLVSAQVVVRPRAGALTDSTGRFNFVSRRSGVLVVEAASIGFASAAFQVHMPDDSALVLTVGLHETSVPLCGLVVCRDPFSCYEMGVIVRDYRTGIAPEAAVTLSVRSAAQADSSVHEAGPGASHVALSAGKRLTERGRFSVAVSAPGYATWRYDHAQRDECRVFRPSPLYVWLIPLQ